MGGECFWRSKVPQRVPTVKNLIESNFTGRWGCLCGEGNPVTLCWRKPLVGMGHGGKIPPARAGNRSEALRAFSWLFTSLIAFTALVSVKVGALCGDDNQTARLMEARRSLSLQLPVRRDVCLAFAYGHGIIRLYRVEGCTTSWCGPRK